MPPFVDFLKDNAASWGALILGKTNNVLFAVTAFLFCLLWGCYYLYPACLRLRATRALKRGDLSAASEAFLKAVHASPRDARLWFGRALTLRRLERWDDAYQALRVVENLEPFQFPAHKERVFVLRALKRFDEALQETSQWIARDDCPEEEWLIRSALEMETQRFEDAEKDCNYLIGLGTESICAEAFNNRGVARLMMGRDVDAESDFETSYLLDPRSTEARARCANFWLRRNLPQKALALCEATIKIDPSCAVAYRYRGLAKRALGDVVGAEEDFTIAERLKTSPNVFLNR